MKFTIPYKFITIIPLILSFFNLYGNSCLEDDYVILDEIITHREFFIEQKLKRIDSLRQAHARWGNSSNLTNTYQYYYNLYEEYKTFKFDSAFCCAKKIMQIARQINDVELISISKIEFSDILITAGIFNEAIDTLNSVKISPLPRDIKSRYYEVLSRGYFDMESFSQSMEYANIYRNRGMAGLDSAMVYIPESSWKHHSLKAQKYIKIGNNAQAIKELKSIFELYDLSNSEIAEQFMSLAFTYGITGNTGKKFFYLIKATIADFKEAKMDAVALLFLADNLYKSGDIIRASKYVNIALEDSRYYGSNFRLWQVSNFLPFIKAEHISTVEKQKKQLWNYAVVVTLLALLVGISFFIIVTQIKRLRRSKLMVEETNNKLAVSNEELMLANRIKEKYIGYYFEISSRIIEKLGKFKQVVSHRLKKNQLVELRFDVDNINIHKEKTSLYFNFDKAFLEIFPEFVKKINFLLSDDQQVHLKKGQLLNTELRIFALIRLGINDADKLANILGYSVNTIYAYKSKMKNRAKKPELFEKEVMLITRSINANTLKNR